MRRWDVLFLSMLVLMVAACSNVSNRVTVESLPEGNAAHGADLFTQTINGAPACSTCHTIDGTTLVGPSLQGYGAVAGTRESDQSARGYTYASIVRPAAYIVNGFSNSMYNQYERNLTPDQIADLIAYLLTL